ncbi:phage portal protein [Lacticaseibacillus pabuli]|uniref:Phage portal protein n=1 Tax=Lacticaseibacillus pabuli TaxID=3025672 RepID=A0ABY7WPM7_9LACO|nr:phage portal protein [Lacticaseibacillus sp. KACC 23028]WDF82066.1 phage portal protein [Lacticaseibacillus sp. KACC 23028]
MSFIKDTPPETRDDNSEPFLDALVSMTSNDSGVYVGASALRNSDIFTAVRVIASDIASNPITYNDDRISKLLNKSPNANTTAWAFKFSLAATMLLNGNAFALISRNNSNQVTELRQIPNSQMVVSQDDTTGKLTYTYTPPQGRSKRLAASDVLHFKCYTADGYTGISPLYALKDELDMQKTGNKLVKDFYKSGVNGSGWLRINKAGLSADAAAAIRDGWENANAGTLRTLVTDDTMDYQALPVNTDVLKLVNSSDWTSRQVAKAFGLPLERLGLEAAHSNSIQGNLLYLQNTLTQYFASFTSELNFKLGTGSNVFAFDTSAFFTADPTTMQDNAIKGLQAGLLTVNEARDKVGLPPVAGGDTIMTTNTYAPLTQLETTNSQNGSEPLEQ